MYASRPVRLIMKAPWLFVIVVGPCQWAHAELAIETETARTLPRGRFEVGAAVEYQTSTDGRELATPIAIEYGILDRTELLLESVPYTRISPSNGRSTHGYGDSEVTLTQKLFEERGNIPAFAFAAEVKFPTARKRQIGTGKADFTGYAIASKRFGPLDLHANIGLTHLGSPPGQHLNNIVDFAFAGEYTISHDYEVFGEVLANTSSGSSGDTTNTSNPEVSGAVADLTGGLKYYIQPNYNVFAALVYDNNQATLLRVGFNCRF